MENSAKISKHIERYQTDPLAFIREAIGVEPTGQQIEIIQALIEHRFVAARSGNRIGKSAAAAWLLLWFITCFEDVRIPCTSPSYGQLFNGIWAETQKWYRQLIPFFKEPFMLTAEALYHRENERIWRAYIKTATKENPEVLAGAHSTNIFLILDEASGIAEEVVESVLPALGAPNAYCLMLGNPLRSNGFFYNVFNNKPSIFEARLKFSSEDSSMMSKKTITAWEKSHGRDSNFFRIRVLGEFPRADDDQLIPLYLIDDAINRRLNKPDYAEEPMVWGVDVGVDVDATVVARRKGRKLMELLKRKNLGDTTKVAGWVAQLYDETSEDDRPERIFVDEIGIGRGPLDMLKNWGLPVKGVNVGTTSKESRRFRNTRAELWFAYKDWLQKEYPQVPNDEELVEDSISPKYSTTQTGKIEIESKKTIKKRLKRSTDCGDAVCLTFFSGAREYGVVI